MDAHIGQVSPDGRWMWDGSQWVPNNRAPAGYLPAHPYESAAFRSTFVMVFLGVNELGVLLAIGLDVVIAANHGTLHSSDEGAVIGFGVLALGFLVVYYGSLIPAIVLFCMWLHRIIRNMPALGAPDPRWTPGGAVGRCFVPFLNLLHPYYSVLDAWRGSDPAMARADQAVRLRVRAPALLIGWWIAWIGGRLISVFSSGMVNSADPSRASSGAVIDIVAYCMIGVAAVLAILVVRNLTRRQDLKHELISSGRLS